MSLKVFSETAAAVLGLTPAALYERQRALIRLGALPAPVGKGRGNGLPATPETVAMLVAATLATDNLSDTDDRVRRLSKSRTKERCKLTGKTTFLDAFTAILASRDLAERVHTIEVDRTALSAEISFDFTSKASSRSRFGKPTGTFINLSVVARLPGWGAELLAKDLEDAAAGRPLGNHTPI